MFAAAYAKIAAALQGVNLTSGQAPSPEVIARLQKLSTEIDSAKVSQAERAHLGVGSEELPDQVAHRASA